MKLFSKASEVKKLKHSEISSKYMNGPSKKTKIRILDFPNREMRNIKMPSKLHYSRNINVKNKQIRPQLKKQYLGGPLVHSKYLLFYIDPQGVLNKDGVKRI